MSVCCKCCVLSGRGLSEELMTRPEESYTECGVSECDSESSIMRPWPTGSSCAMVKKERVISYVY
jgi:hypothetical protein